MARSEVTVGWLRAEMALYADDAIVVVHVPERSGQVHALSVVDVGYGTVMPDEVLGDRLILEAAPLP